MNTESSSRPKSKLNLHEERVYDVMLALRTMDHSSDQGTVARQTLDAGRQLSENVIASYVQAWCAQNPTTESQAKAGAQSLEKLLTGRTTPGECLLGVRHLKTLHSFLQAALRTAIKWGTTEGEKGAGAIYLHNWQHDELVMAASEGFPFMRPSAWLDDYRKSLREGQNTLPELEDEQNTLGELENNLSRLHHVSTVLQPMILETDIARHNWVREELRAVYDTPVVGLDKLDCNKALIGVAYYKPGSGITGRLFDSQEGPKLERPAIVPSFLTDFTKHGQSKWGMSSQLVQHMETDMLMKRTIVYHFRDQMAAGRQVKAGTYEGLQFPDSKFIGPFLGTVLRFNGEHLGILKVEKHQFDATGKQPKPPMVTDSLWPWKVEASSFGAEKTLDFLVLAYALSGILYLLKHHFGVNMSEGWTTAKMR